MDNKRKKEIAERLSQISEDHHQGNDSAMARKLDITPQSLYRYTNATRTPGAEFLIRLSENGYNANWVLTGNGSMLLNDQSIGKAAEPSVHYHVKEKSIAKMLQIIINRLEEVDFGEDIKMEILKETLNRISVEQNAHFLEKELNRE